ncbi:hypothetical protein [Parashewanella tropica]|uniref:hypothetical protein n=1 Tax=Parashewanella tropica TaxID=2547970 RepID=UPI001059BFD6|nr:hypothetical protein [Parashewanella tropica]
MRFAVLAMCLFLGACGSTPNLAVNSDTKSIMNLIALAEQSAPQGVKGTFKLPIKATGMQSERVYLNTQDDYRDRRNISVAITPMLAFELDEKYGSAPDKFFLNKTVEVTGEVKRVKIYFLSKGKMTDKYYFQTQIKISSLDQIKVIS